MARRDLDQPTVRLPAISTSEMSDAPTLRLTAAQRLARSSGALAKGAASKVPEITLYFWVIKLLTTAFGEAASDYLVHRFDPIFAVMLGAVGFAIAITAQLLVRRYIAGVYWLAISMVALFGTMAADVVHIVLGVPYVVSTAAFLAALALIFVVWQRTEGTLSIHSITTPRREWFYWVAIIATFALGTAAGDTTAYTAHLGYFPSALLFIGLFAIPALAYWLLGLNEIVAFWWAYILTRPIGASIADWLGKSVSDGGVGIGPGKVSLILVIPIIALGAWLSFTRADVQG